MIFSILEQALIMLPLVIGAYLTISLLKLPDFSIESAYLFGAVAAFLAKEMPLPIVFLSAIGGGMIVGATVSFLNQILHIPFLLAAIITNGLFHGFIQYLLGTSMKSFHLALPVQELILFSSVAVILLFAFGLMSRSQLGYSWAIYGNNPQFFHQYHLSGRYVACSGVILGHGCAGISGLLFAQANGFVDLTMNFGTILLCLTAMMLGRLLISTHRPHLLVPLIGVVVFFLIQQSLLRIGLNLKYFNAFQAICILFFLYLSHRKQKMSLDHLGV